PAQMRASAHGPVRPVWAHGSRVTYAVAPRAESPACRRASASACAVPAPRCHPVTGADPSAGTMTQPTRGLGSITGPRRTAVIASSMKATTRPPAAEVSEVGVAGKGVSEAVLSGPRVSGAGVSGAGLPTTELSVSRRSAPVGAASMMAASTTRRCDAWSTRRLLTSWLLMSCPRAVDPDLIGLRADGDRTMATHRHHVADRACRAAGRDDLVLPPIRTLTVGPGVSPGQPLTGCKRVVDYHHRFGIAPTPEHVPLSMPHARRRPRTTRPVIPLTETARVRMCRQVASACQEGGAELTAATVDAAAAAHRGPGARRGRGAAEWCSARIRAGSRPCTGPTPWPSRDRPRPRTRPSCRRGCGTTQRG